MRKAMPARMIATAILIFGAGLCTVSAQADPIEDFYKGKTITVYIGTGAGGGYDFYGRLVARHLGKHIPGNPNIVPTNMPGAGTLRAANYLYNAAPKDGTALGIITQTVALEEALGTPEVRFKAGAFNYIGRVTSNVEVTISRQASKAKTIKDVMTNEIAVAGTGAGLASVVYPTVLNNVVGTKFKVVAGYTGSTESLLALERGEVDGALTSWNSLKTTQKDALDNQKVNLLVQYTLTKHADLPNVPTMVELGRDQGEKQVLSLYASTANVGRSILAPPDMPKDRVTALRAAFDAMLRDPAFLAEIEKTKAEFDPLSGEKLQLLIQDATSVPEAVRQRARTARGL